MLQCPECSNTGIAQFMGYEDPGVYDGVLVWQCLACGHYWPRKFNVTRRDEAAAKWAAELNESKEE